MRTRVTSPAIGPYLPPSMTGGNLPGTPQQGFPVPHGKSRSVQNMGNYTGQRTAGMTKGGNQFAHAFGHYGKLAGDQGDLGDLGQ